MSSLHTVPALWTAFPPSGGIQGQCNHFLFRSRRNISELSLGYLEHIRVMPPIAAMHSRQVVNTPLHLSKRSYRFNSLAILQKKKNKKNLNIYSSNQ